MNEAIFTLPDAATVATGLMAGVYFIYAVAIMTAGSHQRHEGK